MTVAQRSRPLSTGGPHRPSPAAAPGGDVRAALNALLKDQTVPREQKPSIGCNIKWKG